MNEYTGEPGRNPAMDPAGSHVATVRVRFVNGGLQQLFWPCDGVSVAEWRDVESVEVAPPVPDPDA